MLFNTWDFAIFFVITFGVYHSLRLRAQNVFLLAASYLFFGWWDWRFLGLLLLSTLIGFTLGRTIEAATGRRRKVWLVVGLCVDLSILGFFKYFNFFVDSAASLLQALGVDAHPPILRIILPAGISFYTFQTMAYTIEVYRGDLKASRSLLNFALFVSYFPHLVAGPIQRPQHLLPQFDRPRSVRTDALASGALLFLIGLVRKVAIADVINVEVDRAFADPASQSALALARATFLFALQIYCDFAGYSDMARGVSRMLGIELTENFRHPYFATNITEFWRRWHISLSSWLRDYLYIPLGGNRGPTWFVYRNLMLTMLLGGLWHGASWTFVAWGGMHGVALAAHRAWSRSQGEAPQPTAAGGLLGWAATMLVVGVAWIFFRAPTFANAYQVLAGIASLRGGFDPALLAVPALAAALTLFLDLPQYFRRDDAAVMRLPWMARGLAYVALVLVLVLHKDVRNVPFIYFQF